MVSGILLYGETTLPHKVKFPLLASTFLQVHLVTVLDSADEITEVRAYTSPNESVFYDDYYLQMSSEQSTSRYYCSRF